MDKKLKIALSFVASLLSAMAFAQIPSTTQGDVQAGERKAATCVACHGVKGVSVNPLWPNLAGQQKDYTKKQLTDFKAGRRVNPLMSPIAMSLSDQDMNDLAEYFSSLH